MKVQLLHDNILVKMDEVEEKTASGIYLPERKKNRDTGEVVQIGPKVKNIKVGDRVKKFSQVKGEEILEGANRYLILREGTYQKNRQDIELILGPNE